MIDQTEMRVLPAVMPMPSSTAMRVSPQPSKCSDRNIQMTTLIGVPQPLIRERVPSDTRNR